MPKFNSQLNVPERLDEDLAEETGLHIGDGSMNFYKNGNRFKGSYSLRGHLFDDRLHYDKIIRPLYKRLFDLNISLREMPSTGVYGFQKWSDDLVNFKNKFLGLPLGPKLNVKIPNKFFKRDFLLKATVRGIFDTDGMLYLEPKNHKLYPRIEISTTSGVLGHQLHKIVNNFGIRATIYLDKKTNENWNNIFKVCVRGDIMLDKWMSKIEPHNFKYLHKYQYFIDNS